MIACNQPQVRRKLYLSAVKLTTLTDQQLAHRRAAAWYDRHEQPGAADFHEWRAWACGVAAGQLEGRQ